MSVRVYSRFERKINGKTVKFWIQDLTEDRFDEAVNLFLKHFVADEPMCKAIRLNEHEDAMKEARNLWEMAASQKCSLACLTELENGQIQMVALNFCVKDIPDDLRKGEIFQSTQLRKLFGNLNYMMTLKDHKEVGIEEYLGALGLFTVSEYRGHNIGLELLNARKPLCASLGLKATITAFSSPASQRLAEKAGFKDLSRATFKEIEKSNPELKMQNIEQYSTCIRYMYMIYD